MKNATLKTATAQDFKIGTTLFDAENNQFTIYEQYGEGMYNARTVRGHVVVFSANARFYTVAV
mgnify:CR=1 FL=1